MILLGVILFLIFIFFSLNLWLIDVKLNKILKDQQEIKTRLHWVKWRQLNLIQGLNSLIRFTNKVTDHFNKPTSSKQT